MLHGVMPKQLRLSNAASVKRLEIMRTSISISSYLKPQHRNLVEQCRPTRLRATSPQGGNPQGRSSLKEHLHAFGAVSDGVVALLLEYDVTTVEDLAFLRAKDINAATYMTLVQANRLRAAVKGARQVQQGNAASLPWVAESDEPAINPNLHDMPAATASGTAVNNLLETTAEHGLDAWQSATSTSSKTAATLTPRSARSAHTTSNDSQCTSPADLEYAELESTPAHPEQQFTMNEGLPAWALSFSPCSRFLAAGVQNGDVMVFDLKAGSLREVLQHHTAEVTSLTWSPDGGTLVSTSHDGRIRMTVLPDMRVPLSEGQDSCGRAELLPSLPGMSDRLVPPEVYGTAFSRDGQTLVTVCDDQALRVWDLARQKWLLSGEHSLPEGQGMEGPHLSVLLSDQRNHGKSKECARLLALAGRTEGGLSVWDLTDGSSHMKFHRIDGGGISGEIYSVAQDAKGEVVAASCEDGWIYMLHTDDIKVGTETPVGAMHHGEGPLYSVCVSPCGKLIVSGGTEGELRFWRYDSATRTGTLMCAICRHKPVHAVAMSPNGEEVAAAFEDGVVKTYSVAAVESRCQMSPRADNE